MYTCAIVRIEVIGQLAGVGSLLHHVGPRNPISPQVWQQMLSLLNYLALCYRKDDTEARSTHMSIHTALKTVGNVFLPRKGKFPFGVDALAFPSSTGFLEILWGSLF